MSDFIQTYIGFVLLIVLLVLVPVCWRMTSGERDRR